MPAAPTGLDRRRVVHAAMFGVRAFPVDGNGPRTKTILIEPIIADTSNKVTENASTSTIVRTANICRCDESIFRAAPANAGRFRALDLPDWPILKAESRTVTPPAGSPGVHHNGIVRTGAIGRYVWLRNIA